MVVTVEVPRMPGAFLRFVMVVPVAGQVTIGRQPPREVAARNGVASGRTRVVGWTVPSARLAMGRQRLHGVVPSARLPKAFPQVASRRPGVSVGRLMLVKPGKAQGELPGHGARRRGGRPRVEHPAVGTPSTLAVRQLLKVAGQQSSLDPGRAGGLTLSRVDRPPRRRTRGVDLRGPTPAARQARDVTTATLPPVGPRLHPSREPVM